MRGCYLKSVQKLRASAHEFAPFNPLLLGLLRLPAMIEQREPDLESRGLRSGHGTHLGKRSVTFSFRLAAAVEIGLTSARSTQVPPAQVPLASSAR
jgi:hypothetical protein